MAKNITQTIRYCRALKGWSQTEAARRLGVSQSTFNSWESGKKIPSFEQTIYLYQLFGDEEVIDAVTQANGTQMHNVLLLLPQEEAHRLAERMLIKLQQVLP